MTDLHSQMSMFWTLSFQFNSLPKDKILNWSKLKAFADDKLKVAKIMTFVLDSVENIVGKGENASFSGSLKVGIVW